MTSPQPASTSDGAAPDNAAFHAKRSQDRNGDAAGGTPEAEPGDSKATDIGRPPYLTKMLEHAERLLAYAAEAGIDVDEESRTSIVHARAVGHGAWTEEMGLNLLSAFTKLAARVKPVTAESLKACINGTGSTVTGYVYVGAVLGILVLFVSLATFLSSGIADAISKDIVTANELAVKLTTQLGQAAQRDPATGSATLPPGVNATDVITELQQFASTIRAIDGRAGQLNYFVAFVEQDPFSSHRKDADWVHKMFQLPVPLSDYVSARDNKIPVYQDVRFFAQSILHDVSVFYGAITTCILPVLYALLGTCAFLLRSFEQQMHTRTFVGSKHGSIAHFLVAAIGGAVVGLFNSFNVARGATISPLAIAFLVGYAVDVFFSFLEGLIQTFINRGNQSPAPAAAAAQK